MDALQIGSRREVCWDEYLMDTAENVQVKMHKPEFRGEALHCNKPWEGDVCTYFTVLRDGEHYRLYYLGLHHDIDEFGNVIEHDPYLCYAAWCCGGIADPVCRMAVSAPRALS